MSIDHCYETVIAKLTADGRIKDVSYKLLSLKTNDERVMYIQDIFESLNAFPSLEVINKSDDVSTYYRNQGNECYHKKNNYEAWQYYNLSLLHAPFASDSYPLAIANRSAIFFVMQKYEECLNDIECVFSMEYPEKLKDKLRKRRELCNELKSRQEKCSTDDKNTEITDILSLKGTRHRRYPSASTKLQVMFTKDMGRHVVAKEDIKVGEVLVEEDPYFTLVIKSQILFSCSYCLSRTLNLLPCAHCCFAFYCSKQCRINAWREYHEIECPLMTTLIDMDFTKLELLALRTVIKARNDHPTWTSLIKAIYEAEANMNSEFHGHVKVNGEWVYDSKYYPSIHTLESNVDKRTVSDIFQKAVTAAVFLKFLSDGTNFFNCDVNADVRKIQSRVGGMLLLHIMTSPTNMHGISSNIQTIDGNFVEEVSLASAPYAFHSLLNHSCAPNVVRFTMLGSGRMKLFALRPIKKGMQIFDNYGSHHALQDRSSRQASLKFQYKFNCLCEACVNDWPMYLRMLPSKKIPVKITRLKSKVLSTKVINFLQKGDKDTAVKVFSHLCSLCEDLEPYAPCMELSDCQEALKQCLVIFQGLVPYGHTELIKWKAKLAQYFLD
ncbi:SET and MYND domain-containing protein 4 [Epargyreus clarus]|uniref:SET and MYND domain-containing protein 4 n=1 Tax=Epargyreus clarus TaxID=520877 RepID=UPI003C30D6AE